MKRFVSLFLSVLLCLTLVPAVALPRAEAAGDVTINATNFPDAKFRSFVSGFDTDRDGVLSASELAAVDTMNLSGAAVTDMKGVEYFTELVSLRCDSSPVKSLDVSANAKLASLSCTGCSLTALTLGTKPVLTSLNCLGNNLTSLDVSGCPALTTLNVSANRLTALDVSANTELQGLWCPFNQLKALDVSHNPALECLSIPFNSIPLVDVSACPNLVHVIEDGAVEGMTYGDEPFVQYYAEDTSCTVFASAATVFYTGLPAILTQPANQSGGSGQIVHFQVKAGGGALTYQWYYRVNPGRTWKKCSGDGYNTAVLNVEAHSFRDGYQYRCRISNAAGYRYSAVASLTFCTRPRITAQPADVSVPVGGTATFSVSAVGGALSYRWEYRTPISNLWNKCSGDGYNTPALTVEARYYRDGYQYRCVVRNAVGAVRSVPAVLHLTEG